MPWLVVTFSQRGKIVAGCFGGTSALAGPDERGAPPRPRGCSSIGGASDEETAQSTRGILTNKQTPPAPTKSEKENVCAGLPGRAGSSQPGFRNHMEPDSTTSLLMAARPGLTACCRSSDGGSSSRQQDYWGRRRTHFHGHWVSDSP
jgi:hypothetical protein